MAVEEEPDDAEQKQGLHELCRGAFEPLRSAIQAELILLPGCRSLYENGSCATNGNINREAVVEHIILDMTGSPAADAGDASLQRSLRQTKHLLTRSNSVLLFRLVMMVLVACMLMFTTILTWNFTRTFNEKSMENLSLVLRHQILLSSVNSVAFVLNQAYTFTLSLSFMHRQALRTHENGSWSTVEEELRDVNWSFFETVKHLHSVAFLSHDGRVTDFTREDHSEFLYFTQNSTIDMKQRWFSQSVTNSVNGHGVEPMVQSLAAPFEEKFLVDLLAHHNFVWSMDMGKDRKHYISCAVPVINRQTKQLLGMSISTTTLKDVHHYLSTIDLLGGYLYFFRSNALGNSSLVATSYTDPNDIHLYPEKALNLYVAEAATYLESAYGSQWLLQNETHSEDVNLRGKLFYIDTMPLQNQFKSLELTAVILLPRASIMGEMDARSKTVIKVSVGAALGVLAIGFLLICILTRRMSTEMQLRQELIRQLVAKHKAEQSSNYKTQFLTNMSHEMRTPMTGIIGLLDLLACDSLTPDQETSVAQIRQCATGLLALVNNILDISTIEAGKIVLEVSPLNLSEELESLVDMFAAQSLGPNVDVTLDLSGCGIPVTLQETVFDRFFQADSSTTRNHGGSGLGLYIVRSLVNMMGGDVQVVPKPGPGTCMRFHFILEKPTYSDGDKAGSCLERPRLTLLDDGLSAFITSHKSNSEVETASSSETLTGTHALVALPDSVAKSVTMCWLQRRGLSVTSVNNWEDVIPTLSILCRSFRVEGMSLGPCASYTSKETICASTQSPASPFALPSAGSSSCVSEINMEGSGRPVLALIDVALVFKNLIAECNAGLKGGKGNVRNDGLNEQRVLTDLRFLQDSLRLLPARNNLLLAWVVSPTTDPWLKQALLSLTPSILIKKPLHSSRLRRLLVLLTEACRLDQAPSGIQSCTSSVLSTPRLTGVRSPFQGAGSDFTSWNSESDADRLVSTEDECKVQKMMVEKELPNSLIAFDAKNAAFNSEHCYRDMSPILASPKSLLQEKMSLRFYAHGHVNSEDSPSTPESPTSGLITPEGTNSIADGVQEVRKDAMYTKELDNEWKGPVIDLKMPSESKVTFRHTRMPPMLICQSSTLPSASESFSATLPSCSPCRDKGGILESEVLCGVRILLVEDTPVLQRLVSTMLRKLGAHVTVVGDGLQAVETVTRSSTKQVEDCHEARRQEVASDSNFDLILMDCAMPVMDGYGATKAIRESELDTKRHIPIVALTAHALASDEERCLSVGMDAYLTKPINYKQLVSTVRKLVLRESQDL